MAQVQYYGTGRRKHSVARVRLVPGEGRILVNKRDLNEYFGLETLKLIVKQPLNLTETLDKYDVLVIAHGGGMSGQAGAIRHGISRALLKADPEFRGSLKRAGFLTRDPRMKERKKVRLESCPPRSSVLQALRFTGRQVKALFFCKRQKRVLFFVYCGPLVK